jgi:cytochrome c-type biogenesis protein CcmE
MKPARSVCESREISKRIRFNARVSKWISFLVGEDQKLKVSYTGSEPLPDTFRDGAQALAEGKMGADGVFHAAKIQAKCASKYAPKPGDFKPVEANPKISLNKQGA